MPKAVHRGVTNLNNHKFKQRDAIKKRIVCCIYHFGLYLFARTAER